MSLCDTLKSKVIMSSESQAELASLLEAVAMRDQSALAELYRQVEGAIYAFALSRLANAGEAADIVHEVMLVVWRRAGSFQGRSRPLTWILGIAHHKIIDTLRRSGRFRDDPADENRVDGSPGPLENLAGAARRAVVRRALKALSDAHRQVVHLAFFEDLSYPEIARLLGIPEGTVKTRMFHAKKALRQRLGNTLQGGAV